VRSTRPCRCRPPPPPQSGFMGSSHARLGSGFMGSSHRPCLHMFHLVFLCAFGRETALPRFYPPSPRRVGISLMEGQGAQGHGAPGEGSLARGQAGARLHGEGGRGESRARRSRAEVWGSWHRRTAVDFYSGDGAGVRRGFGMEISGSAAAKEGLRRRRR
jgi:hypothetical protein